MPSLVGHEAIVRNIEKLAQRGGLSHGYIFFGPAMVGKRTAALALARFLEKGLPSTTSRSEVVLGRFAPPAENEILQDAKVVDLAFAKQLDAKLKDSISIDAVREIKKFLWQKPNASAKRTLVIDEAELLTTEAQNALLKITEEPPASSLLIIITSDIESLMGTIRSRLPQIYFGAATEAEIAKWLMRDHALIQAKAVPLAKRALGKPGLAWRLTHDKILQKNLELAEKFLRTAPAARRDFIKKLLAPEEFNLRNFLDAVIMNLAWEQSAKSSKAKAALWHKALALQQNATNFGLNPRLQLENLLIS